jgi:hypothetical protein
VQRKIGEHKKQAEEREQEETKIQGEMQQGGDGKDGMADVPARTNDSTRILGPA